MAGNTIGKLFCLTTFGESHGAGIGGIIDGCPSQLVIDFDFIQSELNRRRPGQSALSSPRDERDQLEFLSGIMDGTTTGAPIAFIVRNEDTKSSDYDHLKDAFRPSHADYTWQQKFGIRDHRGGGRSSARETISRVVAGAIAKLYLRSLGIEINAFVSAIGELEMESDHIWFEPSAIENSQVRCPDPQLSGRMEELIRKMKEEGDTLGGVILCRIDGLPLGLGEPVFHKFHADLAHAVMGINAVKAFEIGSGFAGCRSKGSLQNDRFVSEEGKVRTLTNHSGGIQGGITNGESVYFRVGFKPVATLMQSQQSVDMQGNEVVIQPKGRHDVCVVPRAVPIVEAMAALVTMDHLLQFKAYQ
jgi:chorismate synthase